MHTGESIQKHTFKTIVGILNFNFEIIDSNHLKLE